PVMLSGVIERALAKTRAERFQTSRELLDALMLAHSRTTHFERANLETMAMQAPLASAGAQTPVPAGAAPVHDRQRAAVGWIVAGVVVAGLAGFALLARRAPNAPPAAVSSRADPATHHAPPAEATRSPASESAPPADASASAAAPAAPPAESRENERSARTAPAKVPSTRGRSPTPQPPAALLPSSPRDASDAKSPAPPPASGASPATNVSPPPIESSPVAPVTTAPAAPPPGPPAAAAPAARPDDSPDTAAQE